MRSGHTQKMIEEIGLYLERHPTAEVLLVSADMRGADYIMRQVLPRVRWRRSLRDGMRIFSSSHEVRFGSGSRLRVISAQSRSVGRGYWVDQLFVEDRVWDLPHYADIINALRPCEWKREMGVRRGRNS